MLTMTAIMQEATPKPSRIGSQRTSLMAWAKGGRRKKERFEDLVSTFEPESVVVQTTPIQHGAYPQQPQHRLSAVYEDGDSEDEDEEAIRTVPQDSGRQGAYVSAKLTAMMSSKSSRQKYAGTVNRRYSQVPEQGQVAKMMGQTKQSKRTSLPPSSNVINLGGNKLPKLAPAPKEYRSPPHVRVCLVGKRVLAHAQASLVPGHVVGRGSGPHGQDALVRFFARTQHQDAHCQVRRVHWQKDGRHGQPGEPRVVD
jgi:hypothetical protein